MGALSHIRVLDLSRVLAGPWASQILADLGAEVIKIERPGHGDDTRAWGPPFMSDSDGEPTSESAYYLCTNRGKQSVCVDMKTPEGQAVIRQLAADSDQRERDRPGPHRLPDLRRADARRERGLQAQALAGG